MMKKISLALTISMLLIFGYSAEKQIDSFAGSMLKNWHTSAVYWEGENQFPVPTATNNASISRSTDPAFFSEGSGALKVFFPSGPWPYAITHFVLTKDFSPVNITDCNTLVFYCFLESGGGSTDISLFDATWSKNIKLATNLPINTPGLKRFVLSAPSGNFADHRYLVFQFKGDFTLYLSNIKAVSADAVGEEKKLSKSLPQSQSSATDVTLKYL